MAEIAVHDKNVLVGASAALIESNMTIFSGFKRTTIRIYFIDFWPFSKSRYVLFRYIKYFYNFLLTLPIKVCMIFIVSD